MSFYWSYYDLSHNLSRSYVECGKNSLVRVRWVTESFLPSWCHGKSAKRIGLKILIEIDYSTKHLSRTAILKTKSVALWPGVLRQAKKARYGKVDYSKVIRQDKFRQGTIPYKWGRHQTNIKSAHNRSVFWSRHCGYSVEGNYILPARKNSSNHAISGCFSPMLHLHRQFLTDMNWRGRKTKKKFIRPKKE